MHTPSALKVSNKPSALVGFSAPCLRVCLISKPGYFRAGPTCHPHPPPLHPGQFQNPLRDRTSGLTLWRLGLWASHWAPRAHSGYLSLKANQNQALGFLDPIPCHPPSQQGGLPGILVVTSHPLKSTEECRLRTCK